MRFSFPFPAASARCPRLEKRFIATDGRKPFLRLITLRAELSFPRRSASTVAQIRAVQYGETDVSSSPAPSQSATTWHSALMNPKFASKIAFRDTARTYTYHDIASAAYANHLKLEEDFRVEKTTKTKSKTLNGKRIGIYTPHDASFLISLWSTWLSGGIAVPLGISHPEPQLEYFLRNSDTSVILCSKETEEKATKIAKACGAEILPVTPESSDLSDAQKLRSAILPLSPSADDSALILYTSGMTGQPKGVLWKHNALVGQAQAMIDSWAWNHEDNILHVLPLYHLHGLINCLITPLSCGAAVWMDQDFKAEKVWRQLLSSENDRVNVFMAVPTIYVKLLEYYSSHSSLMPSKDEVKEICLSKIRLMVSGSAPLPDVVFRAWEDLTGHKLLERYGMTETGMILSNPLNGPRIPGTVGHCMPQVQARIVPASEESGKATSVATEEPKKSFLGLKGKAVPKVEASAAPASEKAIQENPSGLKTGELQVMGPNMFSGYWNNEKATADSHSDDGWFKTGDTVEVRDGVYRLLGRTSSDIIKSGGYKISALDVERRIQDHPDVSECAVFGVPDDVWGERIVCLAKLQPTASPAIRKDTAGFQKVIALFVAEVLPVYTAPKELQIVEEIPRNGMGKVNKKALISSYRSETETTESQSELSREKSQASS